MTISQQKNPRAKYSKASKSTQASSEQSPVDDEMQEKLVRLPASDWEGLRKKGRHIPEGNFSSKFFARKKLDFNFVEELSLEAKKILFIKLMGCLLTEFDSVICRNMASETYNQVDSNMMLNIADAMDDYSEKNGTVATEELTEEVN